MPDLFRQSSWLRCPVCSADLQPVDRLALGCENGHRHDVNKRGYVSLLGGGSKHLGDTTDMLDAREAVLESGAYSPIAEAVASLTVGERILDAGAGTGYYLRAALEMIPAALGLAMDLSAQAVARAARSSDRIDGLVADTWKPLPVRTAAADTVLDVFAPRNLPEFHRVLRPGGTLVVVVPRPDHLESLRASGTMLDIPVDKADDLIAASEPLYVPLTREHVAYDLPLNSTIRVALAAMGPSARHGATAAGDVDATRVSVDVLRLAPR